MPDARAEERGDEPAARRPRFEEANGKGARHLGGGGAAGGLHQVEAAAEAALAQHLLEAGDVAVHQRLHEGVRGGGRPPLVLAQLRDHLGGEQGSIRLLFEVFARLGSAHGVVKHFREHGLQFPKRLHTGPCRGDLVWLPLGESRALHVLRNPRYAGAYAFGKSATHRTGGGRTFRVLPRERWHALIPSAHEGDITWPQYEHNQRQVADNARARGADRRLFVPREGPALRRGWRSAAAAAIR